MGSVCFPLRKARNKNVTYCVYIYNYTCYLLFLLFLNFGKINLTWSKSMKSFLESLIFFWVMFSPYGEILGLNPKETTETPRSPSATPTWSSPWNDAAPEPSEAPFLALSCCVGEARSLW